MTTLVERDVALANLSAAFESAVTGQGRCVVLGGEAGIGKTALLRHFARSVGKGRVLWGQSDDLFTPNPLGPLRDMAPQLGPAIVALLQDNPSQERVFPAVLDAIQSSGGVTILVFEDLHWADHATLDLVKYLGRRMPYLHAMLVMSLRNDELGADHPVGKVLADLDPAATIRVSLSPLSATGVAELVEGTGLEVAAVHQLTGGNPFYVTELVASHKQSSGEVPASIRDAVSARLQRLPGDERSLLEAISVAPSGAEEWLAEALLGCSARPLLESCEARGLLSRDVEGRYRFRHELSRIATLRRISAEQQRTLHAKALETLLQRPAVAPACLLHHAAGAEDANSVLSLAPKAVEEAIGMGAHRVAASHLRTAIDHVGHAPAEQAAQLFEDWAYEAALAQGPTAEVLASTHDAIAAWRALGHKEKVAKNLRRLSRLHWLKGESQETVRYSDLAIAELADEKPSRELAMAYAVRSQLRMFNDMFVEAIEWSRKAIALAAEFSDDETRANALNNLGSSMLYMGDEDGLPHLEASLALAVRGGYHEQAYRAYVNLSEYAVLARRFPLADKVLSEGISFCTSHDLDVATYNLVGLLAQLRMEQGRFAEAGEMAESVLARSGLSLMSRFPALLTAAKVSMRRQHPESGTVMAEYHQQALSTGEQQHMVPAHFGMIEMAWLNGDRELSLRHLNDLLNVRLDHLAPWDLGEFAVWWRRCGMQQPFPLEARRSVMPHRLELEENHEAASMQWLQLGAPYDAALALIAGGNDLQGAANLLHPIGAERALNFVRSLAREKGIVLKEEGRKRGPYGAARHHPLGLTAKEMQILSHVAEGMTNQQISRRLARSSRTIEHHVSAVLGKFGANNRIDLLLRLKKEPWLSGKSDAATANEATVN